MYSRRRPRDGCWSGGDVVARRSHSTSCSMLRRSPRKHARHSPSRTCRGAGSIGDGMGGGGDRGGEGSAAVGVAGGGAAEGEAVFLHKYAACAPSYFPCEGFLNDPQSAPLRVFLARQDGTKSQTPRQQSPKNTRQRRSISRKIVGIKS